MQKIKTNDEVILISGKNKGKTGKVKKINLKTLEVVVEGVNVVKKAVKPNQANPNGGYIELEAPIQMCKVAILSPKTKKATRVRIEVKNGKKVRVAVACGSLLDK